MATRENLWKESIEGANNFELPPSWDENREEIEAIAIDPPNTFVAEDALGVDGKKQTFDVSVLDLGSFLYGGPIIRYANRYKVSSVQGTPDGPQLLPLLPVKLAHKGINFVNGQRTPAVTVHLPLNGGDVEISKTTVRCIKVDDFGDGHLLDRCEGSSVPLLRDIKSALTLGEVPHPLKDNEGLRDTDIDELHQWAGRFLMHQAMKMVNEGVAKFAIENCIPTIYSNIDEVDPGKKYYDICPAVDGFRSTVRLTRPYQRIEDVANNCNIVAYLDKRKFPYSLAALDGLAGQLNAREKLESPRGDTRKSTFFISKRLSPGKMNIQTIATAIFDMWGHKDRIIELQSKALEYLSKNPAKALGLVNYSIDEGYLAKRNAVLEDGVATDEVLEVTSRTEHSRRSYACPSGYVWIKEMQIIRLMGEICGINIKEPDFSKAAKKRLDQIQGIGSYKFLRGLTKSDSHRAPRLYMYAVRGEYEKFAMNFYLRGEIHSFDVNNIDPVTALREMCSQFISKVGLLENMPSNGVAPFYDPITELQTWQRYTSSKPVEYIIKKASDQTVSCVATLETSEGEVHEVTGIAYNGKIAKRSAAAYLLLKLPEGPYPAPKTKSMSSVDKT